MLNDILKSVGPLLAAAVASRFERGEFRFDQVRFNEGEFRFDDSGVGRPLAEFDLDQPAPDCLVLLGDISVAVSESDTLKLSASGESAEALRFALRDGQLTISHANGSGGAHVDIAMPAPRSLMVAGSGVLSTAAIAAEAKVAIAGSGKVFLDGIRATRLKASIAGSGKLIADGAIERLKLSIAGAGAAELAHLEARDARLSVAGSGSVSLASHGAVEAHLMGSGNVTVYGRARLRLHSVGSGRLSCEPLEERPDLSRVPPESRHAASPPPQPPAPPKAPKAPRPKGTGKPSKKKPGTKRSS